jgi:hypothetical protein
MWTNWRRACLTAAIAATAAMGPLVAESAAQETRGPGGKEEAKATTARPARSPRPGDVTRVFILQHARARPMGQLLQVFPAAISYPNPTDGNLPRQAIGVSAAPAVMAAIEETIKRLDTPPAPRKSVELTAYVLEALATSDDLSHVPPELEGVVTQLKRTFTYGSYRLLDTLIARGTEDSSLDADGLGGGQRNPPSTRRMTYTLHADSVTVLAGGDGPSINLSRLRFKTGIPYSSGPNEEGIADLNIRTDIELRPGQQVVVGKSGGTDPGSAIFLVLSAKVD